MRVWDLPVRLSHWVLAGSVLLAWGTAEFPGKLAATIHEWAGYAVLVVVALRCAWGWIGPRHARFAAFVHSPAQTLAYAKAFLHATEPRYVGHNPLGAWMVVALLCMAALASGSGWLYITDRFWGMEWLEEVHSKLAYTLLGLAALHVAGVVFTSLRHRENLVHAMLSGDKKAPEAGDVD